MANVTVTVELPLRVVIYPAPDLRGQWIAHCLETDQVTQGDSVEHALAMMADAVETLGGYRIERGRVPLLLRPAPKEVWDLVGISKPAGLMARATVRATGATLRGPLPPGACPLYALVSDRPPARAHAG